jgi:LytR cell envelope-related transcriptional attenuator
MKLDPRLRTALTLIVLMMIIGFGAKWGWAKATKPLPQAEVTATGLCRTIQVSAGDKVTPEDVVVSVFNGSDRAGLAQRTRGLFVDQGFGAGEVNNAPKNTGVENAEIWAANPDDPAVVLVASRLKDVDIVEGPVLGDGVVVLVGDKFSGLAKGKASVTAKADVEICAPQPVESSDADPEAKN